jgi:DNA-directed RNA polymerase subunit RPC12/RpoP
MGSSRAVISRCSICKHEYTSIHVEAMPGTRVFVCEKCLDVAKHNFIWICLNCGKVYVRPKETIINRINGSQIRKAHLLNTRIIQGIDICIECDPEGIITYMDSVKAAKAC